MESSLDLTTLFSYQNGRTQIATMHWPSTCVKINASPRKSISVNVLIFISRFDLSKGGINLAKFNFHFDFCSKNDPMRVPITKPIIKVITA